MTQADKLREVIRCMEERADQAVELAVKEEIAIREEVAATSQTISANKFAICFELVADSITDAIARMVDVSKDINRFNAQLAEVLRLSGSESDNNGEPKC